ncbi:MAG: ribonuclease catalytic domain-containing protein, partial [Chlamydiales bacterium]|nr:ribonuclease catalytic domain-containing protein [Chlamydiales bacterium]
MSTSSQLAEIAKRIVIERGLEPEFSFEAMEQLDQITQPSSPQPQNRDLRSYVWCSIDNDTSMDLDQLTYAEKAPDGSILLWVAIADVSALVPKDSHLDIHAQKNTTSIYTPARIFPMLPDKLSCDFTSLKDQADRCAVIVKIQIKDGIAQNSEIFTGIVHNWGKLTYNSVGNWLENKGPIPEVVA